MSKSGNLKHGDSPFKEAETIIINGWHLLIWSHLDKFLICPVLSYENYNIIMNRSNLVSSNKQLTLGYLDHTRLILDLVGVQQQENGARRLRETVEKHPQASHVKLQLGGVSRGRDPLHALIKFMKFSLLFG